jgi:methylenetetrahydrofolate reductase (NADPH)
LKDCGVHLPILVGLAPLASARSAEWIRANLFGSIIPDALIRRLAGSAAPKKEGERICIELIEEFAAIRGVAGAHVMAPLNEAALPSVLAAARQATSAPG